MTLTTEEAIKIAHERDIVCCAEDFTFSRRLLCVLSGAAQRLGINIEHWVLDELTIPYLEEWFFAQTSFISNYSNHPFGYKQLELNNVVLLGRHVVFVDGLIDKYLIQYKKEDIYFPSIRVHTANNFVIACGGNDAIFGGYYYV